MAIILREKSVSSDGIITEQQNLLSGTLSSLTNLQVDANFSQLNKAIKDEEIRAISIENTKVNLVGGNTITGVQNLTGATLRLTTSSSLSNDNVAATNEYVDSAVSVEKTRAETAEATKVNLVGGNTISDSQIFSGSVNVTGTITGPTANMFQTNQYGQQEVIAPDSNLATGNWVHSYLKNILWNPSLVGTVTFDNNVPSIAPAYGPTIISTPAGVTYKGLDLGAPGKEFANLYVKSGVFAQNSIQIGDADLSASDEGGIVLPTNTAIGAADNVIPNNLASSILDHAFAQTNYNSVSKIPLPRPAQAVTNPPAPLGIAVDGTTKLYNASTISAGTITADRFIGYVTETTTPGDPSPVDVVISGRVSGFSNLDFGTPLATVATATPQLNKNDSISVSDGTNTISVAAPGIGSEWASAASIASAINTAATSAFLFNITESSGLLSFTAKSVGTQVAPTISQVTQAVLAVNATYTIAIVNSDVIALTGTVDISDGTTTVTSSDLTSLQTVIELVSLINTEGSALLYTAAAVSGGIQLTYNTAGPITVNPTITGLTITSLATGVVGVPAATTNISVTTTTTGRPEGTIVEYYLNQDGTLTTTTSSTNVKIGTAVSATDLFLYSTSTVDNYVQSQQKIEFTDLSIGANATPSGEGSIAYNNTTGIFTFTPTKVINSASLTGVPTAPTAVPGTDTTQLATTAFVKAALDNLIANSPEALNTLNELAQAINDDASFATSITNSFNTALANQLTTVNASLATKANLNNAALTGTPTAPTPGSTSNDTSIATTAYVRSTSANLNNTVLTGVPTAPTATAGTDTTQLATTAFVSTAVAQGGGGVNIDGGLSNSIRNTTTIALDGGGASG